MYSARLVAPKGGAIRPTELSCRFSGLLAIGLLAGVYWLSSRLGGNLEPCVITAKVAGMTLSPDAVQTLIGERLVRIDPNRSTRSIELYVCQEGVAQEQLFSRIKEILEADTDGEPGRPPCCEEQCKSPVGAIELKREFRSRER